MLHPAGALAAPVLVAFQAWLDSSLLHCVPSEAISVVFSQPRLDFSAVQSSAFPVPALVASQPRAEFSLVVSHRVACRESPDSASSLPGAVSVSISKHKVCNLNNRIRRISLSMVEGLILPQPVAIVG